MAVEAQFSKTPLQVVETDEMRARIKAISDAEKISQAQVVRDMNEHGIDWREQLCRERTAQA